MGIDLTDLNLMVAGKVVTVKSAGNPVAEEVAVADSFVRFDPFLD